MTLHTLTIFVIYREKHCTAVALAVPEKAPQPGQGVRVYICIGGVGVMNRGLCNTRRYI